MLLPTPFGMDIADLRCNEIELFSANASDGLGAAHRLERRDIMKAFSLNSNLIGAIFLNFLLWSGILLLVLQMGE